MLHKNFYEIKNKKDIAGRIKLARQCKGKNIKELSKSMKISDSTIRAWESSRRNISDENLKKLCEKLKLPIYYFKEISVDDSTKLKDIRNILNLTQKELGEKIDVHANTVYRWECNLKKISNENKRKIVEKLNLPENFFNELPSKYFLMERVEKNEQQAINTVVDKENEEKGIFTRADVKTSKNKQENKATKENKSIEEIIKIKYTKGFKQELKNNLQKNEIDMYAYAINIYKKNGEPRGAIEGAGEVEFYEGEILTVDFGVSLNLKNKYIGKLVPKNNFFSGADLVLIESVTRDKKTVKGIFMARNSGKIKVYENLGTLSILEKNNNIKFTEIKNI